MYFRIAATFLCLGSLLLGSMSLDRDEIVKEYTPILESHRANITEENQKMLQEAGVVLETLANDTVNIITLLNSQIKGIQTTIAAAEADAVNKTDVLACLKTQETAASQLSDAAVNKTCWVDENFASLTSASESFEILSGIPNKTIESCTNLDPLASQDQLFLDCITGKILDLDTQLLILRSNFASAKNSVMKTFLQCLANQSALVAQSINEINFQVTLCVTMG